MNVKDGAERNYLPGVLAALFLLRKVQPWVTTVVVADSYSPCKADAVKTGASMQLHSSVLLADHLATDVIT